MDARTVCPSMSDYVQTVSSCQSVLRALYDTVSYCIVGKFGRENVWQIYSFQVFCGKIWQMKRPAKGLLIVATTVLQIVRGGKVLQFSQINQ